MKKPYVSATYEITHYKLEFVLTVSSDRENAYVSSGDLWNDNWDFDDDD